MTLIITALSEDAVIQVSDRRLTLNNGLLCDDLAIKAICISCADASFSLAYTGLATIQDQRTDEWAVNYLTAINASELNFSELFDTFKKYAVSTFSRLHHLGRNRRITFVIAGFNYFGPFMGLLSNIEDGKGNWLNDIDDNFQSGFYFRNDKPIRKLDLMINGTENATETLDTAIAVVRKRFFRKSPERIATVLVQLVRKAADHPKFGHLIGSNCISAIVNPAGEFLCQDYLEKASPQRYAPHLILRGAAYKNIQIWTGNGVPPWWSGNND